MMDAEGNIINSHLIVKTSELQLADVVRRVGSRGYAYDYCTVRQIKDGVVTLFRPYVHTADFSGTGGVICYIGTEDIELRVDDSSRWYVLQRKELK